MTRPHSECKVGFRPITKEFCPVGGKDKANGTVEVSREEVETLRLKNLQGLCQTSAAKRMGISQSTFQRMLATTYRKVSDALVRGKNIKIVEHKNK